MVPLAFWFLWRYLGSGGLKWFALVVLAVVYQFYCGMYLGFMLVYGLFFLALGHLVFLRHPGWWKRFLWWRYALGWILVLACGAALLAPVALPYQRMQALVLQTETGVRTFADISGSLPRPIAFFLQPSGRGVVADVRGNRIGCYTQLVGPDAVCRRPAVAGHCCRGGAGFAQAGYTCAAFHPCHASFLVLFQLAFLHGHCGVFPLPMVFELPGFSSLRSVDRIINVQVMFFVLLFVFALRPLFAAPRRAWLTALLLPLLVVQDNRWDMASQMRFNKRDAQELVTEVQRRITREYKGSKMYDAIAYTPYFGIAGPGETHDRLIKLHLTAMLAAQDLGIPTVNAYTGYYPDKYMGFFDGLDSAMLMRWTTFYGVPADRVQQIDGLAPSIVKSDTVRLRAESGAWVAIASSGDRTATADRDSLGPWESFLRLRTGDGRVAFFCTNGSFLCAELEEQQQLAATAMDLGDYGLFTSEPQGDGTIALKANNGLYVTVDSVTNTLFATSPVIGPNAKFKLYTPPFPR
jgi:hypothetical protein